MKKLIFVSALCLVLVACASDTQSSLDEAVTTTTMTTITTTEADNSSFADDSSAPDDSSKPVEKMGITAEVLSYKGGILTFKYEGEEYSLPFSRWDFDNDPYDLYYPSLSECIINNKYGETVYAEMSVDKDISKIFKCDVVRLNGEVYNGENYYKEDENHKRYIDRDLLYSFKRTEGTRCEISNINETLEFDLNDLPLSLRLDYPKSIDPIVFTCYKYNDGKMFPIDFHINLKIVECDEGNDKEVLRGQMTEEDIESYGEKYGFYGVVQSVSDDGKTVTFLLNDKKTLCTVPTFYSESGDINEGMKIMVRLKADTSLFGSGGEHEFDYAVVYTDPEYINQTGRDSKYSHANELEHLDLDIPIPNSEYIDYIDFDDLAYSESAMYMYIKKYTKVSEVE